MKINLTVRRETAAIAVLLAQIFRHGPVGRKRRGDADGRETAKERARQYRNTNCFRNHDDTPIFIDVRSMMVKKHGPAARTGPRVEAGGLVLAKDGDRQGVLGEARLALTATLGPGFRTAQLARWACKATGDADGL